MSFSIYNLKQLSSDQFKAGREKLSKARSITIERTWSDGPVSLYTVSGYTVARLLFGVWCECPDFRFSGEACKHVAVIMPHFCDSCRSQLLTSGECRDCKINNALYLKESSPKRPVERIAGIKI